MSNDGHRRMRQVSGLAVACATSLALLAGCGQRPATVHVQSGGGPKVTGVTSLPRGVMPATRACRLVVLRAQRGFFTHVERVHLVLTTYAKGEPAESQGDISTGMPPGTLVWVVEVHAKAVHWDHSEPANARPGSPSTDYSVVMNARTGVGTDFGECDCWPLPLWKVGTVVSLPARC